MRLAASVATACFAAACSSSTSTPGAPSGPITILEPAHAQSPNGGIEVETRPIFTIINARPPVGALLYRFEVSKNANFEPVLTSSLVSEGHSVTGSVGRSDSFGGVVTTSAILRDLELEESYYWRAETIDRSTRASLGFTQTLRFVTFHRRAGLSMLHVFLPDCNYGTGLTFDGELSIADGSLRFTNAGLGYGSLLVDLGRTATGWFGRATGWAYSRDAHQIHVIGSGAADDVDTKDRDGGTIRATNQRDAVSGTLYGDLRLWDRFGDGGGRCGGPLQFIILR